MQRNRRSGIFKFILGKLFFKITGWKFKGDLVPKGKFILICEPHTSNWDFIFLLAVMFTMRIKISWLGKHTIFKKPFGGFMKWLGGIPVDRRNTHGVVEQITEYFEKHENLIIALSPSGTRHKTDHWKSGFYHIGHSAKVPLLLGYIDYGSRTAGTGPSFIPTGDLKKDMDLVRTFYAGIKGGNPEQESKILLRDE